ncbi:hypothetical protein [Sphingomonas solaris]|uniref:Uncharacterized protein n=1 Tax=Alterirhizorhabdus solaris TaxID=2529389 RepID=A0A558R4R4_9SPHN|nr:hypothetical protein [Sphingomonas solaris]TVV74380.1 hypothetical protein FOY91_09930 [Sphingomonas solaris]
MNGFKLLTLMALAAPVMATAQVGPNPAVSGGSQDPTLRGSVDATTAPQDAGIDQGPTGNVVNRSIDTPTRPADGGATVDADTGTAVTGTTTGTKTTTKAMKKAGRGR